MHVMSVCLDTRIDGRIFIKFDMGVWPGILCYSVDHRSAKARVSDPTEKVSPPFAWRRKKIDPSKSSASKVLKFVRFFLETDDGLSPNQRNVILPSPSAIQVVAFPIKILYEFSPQPNFLPSPP